MRRSEINSQLVGVEVRRGIYQIRHRENGKRYVGSAVDFRVRWNRHLILLRKGTHDNIHLQRAWTLDGEDAFEFSVLEFVADVQRLIAREQFWLDKLDVVRRGYNLAPNAGSRLGTKQTEEAKAKIRASCRGQVRSPETRERMSKAFTGRTMSEAAKAKLSILASKRTRSPETRAKVSAALKGRKLSPDAIAKRTATRAEKKSVRPSVGEAPFVGQTNLI